MENKEIIKNLHVPIDANLNLTDVNECVKKNNDKSIFHGLILFFVFFCINVQAQKYIKAVIFQQDGAQINCMARLPAMFEKNIRFKTDDNRKIQKMKGEEIKSVCYYLRGNNTLEIEYIRYISHFEMSSNMQYASATEWIEVLVRGDMMLYFTQEASRSGQRKAFTYHYYVKKENENYATEIAYLRYRNGFLIYRMEAGDYFSDAPEIEKKIENREEGYTAKDIVNIVKEYNNFKLANSEP